MKKIISILIALVMIVGLSACSSQGYHIDIGMDITPSGYGTDADVQENLSAAVPDVTEEITEKVSDAKEEALSIGDDEIISGIVEYFMPLTKIPRKSHHEEKISEYLASWAEKRGFKAERDKENNVIFDVPGSEGMENAPMTVLQGHMDMVIAVAEGKTFDPLKDGITVINDGTTLKADGTSLGADNGIGIAAILHVIDKNESHGPLRIIFTTDEEDGLTGASALTSDNVAGVKYVINLDSENSKEVTNSSAAAVSISCSCKPGTAAPTKKQASRITISGLLSGHSGVDIDKGRVNGIKAMAYILNGMADEGIDYELVSLEGGSAENAIPAKAAACIVYDSKDADAVKKYVEGFKEVFSQVFGGIEISASVSMEECELPKAVFTAESKADVLEFAGNIFDGVNSMSQHVEGLVESSSNIGLISIGAEKSDKSTANICVRSSDGEKLDEIVNDHISLAKQCGFEVTTSKTADPWPVNPDSRLLEMVKDAYMKETGTEISVVQLHAGLETGTFAKLDPDLDIVSIGFDIKEPHTINEVCYLKTIPTTYRTLENVLAEIGNEVSQ